MLKIYHFSFKGLWMPSMIIVVSDSELLATAHAEAEMNAMAAQKNLVFKDLELENVYEIGEGVIPYSYDGDY